jgi:hypothetical protein
MNNKIKKKKKKEACPSVVEPRLNQTKVIAALLETGWGKRRTRDLSSLAHPLDSSSCPFDSICEL